MLLESRLACQYKPEAHCREFYYGGFCQGAYPRICRDAPTMRRAGVVRLTPSGGAEPTWGEAALVIQCSHKDKTSGESLGCATARRRVV
jgi:hypothetical protein